MEADKIIIAPVVTEKGTIMKDSEPRKYLFHVDVNSNKFEIMKAVKALFQVNPVACNIINVKSKPRNARLGKGKSARGWTSEWKKAIVTLSKGEKIDKFEGA
jgi:large subunit ribosomal protein L23